MAHWGAVVRARFPLFVRRHRIRWIFRWTWPRTTVRVWFKDCYEWHPVYPFYDFQKGDGVRETNCLHPALVELKTSGAADFWMVGEGEVNLSLIAKH